MRGALAVDGRASASTNASTASVHSSLSATSASAPSTHSSESSAATAAPSSSVFGQIRGDHFMGVALPTPFSRALPFAFFPASESVEAARLLAASLASEFDRLRAKTSGTYVSGGMHTQMWTLYAPVKKRLQKKDHRVLERYTPVFRFLATRANRALGKPPTSAWKVVSAAFMTTHGDAIHPQTPHADALPKTVQVCGEEEDRRGFILSLTHPHPRPQPHTRGCVHCASQCRISRHAH